MIFTISMAIIAIVALAVLWQSNAIVFIENESFGTVERKWSFKKKTNSTLIARDGESGFLADTIGGGWHFFVPFQYTIHRSKLITVSEIGYIFARNGQNLEEGQVLARWPEGIEPQDALGFLDNHGQRGMQRKILRGGTYAINLALFSVLTEQNTYQVAISKEDKQEIDGVRKTISDRKGFRPIEVVDDHIGIVTVQDGISIDQNQSIAPTVGTDPTNTNTFHNNFQDIQKFFTAGGRRGLQDQVLTEGTYYINALFATVRFNPKIVIPVGSVGVVNSYTGPQGDSGNTEHSNHGSLVEVGNQGIWKTPLIPGKYTYNPYAYKITEIPTTNFQLSWITDTRENHNFDQNLAEISLITKDAYEPILPLSFVIHIEPGDAPYLIQQFADINRLVEQTLNPMVAAWFKDAAQSMTLMDLVSNRAELQKIAKKEMTPRLKEYRLNLLEVMVGTPQAAPGDTRISEMYNQIRERQLAMEKRKTYESERETENTRRTLQEARAIADQQPKLTASNIQIQIAENEGRAHVQTETKNAEAVEIRARADASRITQIGQAEAAASEAQVNALGGTDAALRRIIVDRISTAIENSKQPIVPQIISAGGNGGLNDGLLGLIINKELASKE